MTGATVFSGGPILTMDDAPGASATAEVVVVHDDRIVAVGGDDLAARYPSAARVNLAGRTLLPGFIDAHNHLCIAALHPRFADLSAVTSMPELVDALAVQARREPEAEWIRGVGWNEERCGFTPTREKLDAIGFERPVVVVHYTYHQAVVCTRGLDALGLGASTPDPPGGEIERDAAGRPTGKLLERAWSIAQAASLRSFTDPDRWGDHIAARARALHRDGITAVHDAACPPEAAAVYRALARSGELPISILAMPHPLAILDEPGTAVLDGAPTGEGDEWMRVGPLKLFADGGVLPAVDVHYDGQPVRFGTVLPGLADGARRAVERGFRVAVHAIGNAGLDAALDACAAAYDGAPDGDARIRVEHAMLASFDQARRLATLGGVAVVQPGFVDHVGRSLGGFEPDDATWLPFATLRRAGAPIAASSDDPCAFHEPCRTSAFGAARRTATGAPVVPAESVPYVDWLRAYTAGAAYAGGQEDERGRLRPGLRADLVMLDGALDEHDPPVVEETWVAGTRVFARDSD
ncbi:MAG TPA: amidohydrolase family protein [Acidimicrobiia bacterium]